jgi:hypothetical protein
VFVDVEFHIDTGDVCIDIISAFSVYNFVKLLECVIKFILTPFICITQLSWLYMHLFFSSNKPKYVSGFL